MTFSIEFNRSLSVIVVWSFSRGKNRGFVHQVSEIRAAETRSTFRELLSTMSCASGLFFA